MKKARFHLVGFIIISAYALSIVSCEEEPLKPTAAISVQVADYQASFTSTVTDVNTYAWDFGDGETGTDPNPVHTYATLGTYTVTLTVTGSGGTAVTSTTLTIEVKPTVIIFANMEGYKVSFTSTVTDVDTYAWDFGDNEVSSEANPVHTYAISGTYTTTLTVTGIGGTASASTNFTIEASTFEMLTGGPVMVGGKTWVISPIASEGDGIYKANAEFQFEDVIPNGVFGLIGLASEYEDEFTFKYDLSYSHVTKNDSVIADLLYCYMNGISYRTSFEDIIVLAPFTPSTATFNFMEDTNLTLEVVDQDDDDISLDVTWNNINVLEIEGNEEFVGILDFTRKYMILDISVEHLQIGIFLSTSERSKMNIPKHVMVITLIPKV